ncbi:MAG: FecR domain-containing protein [Tannerellaceae bacterium]|jgi:ferric-dicitrate binding protein FerR (iron transport regulator)|nr:FecR domain-containing protein [Tannerellaceae bacterium]
MDKGRMDERIIKYFNRELSEEERILLLKELEKDAVLKNKMLNCQNIRAASVLSSENIDLQAGYEGYKHFCRRRLKGAIFYRVKMTAGYAAVVAFMIVVTWKIARSDQKIIEQTISRQELFVPSGQRARITLADGSTVWLNAGSTLLYPSSFEKERKVELMGEAYFDVVKNPDKAFIVSTKWIDIEALGTQFNVKSYPKSESASTALVDGSIKVYKPDAASEGIVLSPNQQLFYENGRFRLLASMDKDELLWKDGVYSFKKERLDVIVKKLELYYDVEIVVKAPGILKYEYTGKFRQRDGVMEILRIIQQIHNFRIDMDKDLNRITIS